MGKTLSIIVPVYNEVKSLPIVLPDIISFVQNNNYRLIVVNDGSKDGSQHILTQYCSNLPFCTIKKHKVNRGYGGAIKSGIRAAQTDYIVTIDADGQHYLNDINKLFNQLKEVDADMIIGSRKGQTEASFLRAAGKRIIRWLARQMMPMNIYDLNSGMKLYNTAMAKKYIELCPNSMAFSDIIGLVFISQKRLVIEHPIDIKPRVGGESTIGIRTAFDTVMEILNIVILFSPMRIFLPLSFAFILLGLAWAIQFLISGNGLSIGASMLISIGIVFFTIGLISEQLSQLRKARALNTEDNY